MTPRTDFSTSIRVDQSPEQVFEAITNVRGWWSQGIQGSSEQLNDEFSYVVPGIHRSTQRLVEVVPNQKVVWLVTDSDMSFIEERDEWVGTKVIFEISREADQTKLTFTHQGLVPEVECYDACKPAWTQYVQHSLFGLITTGQGDPNLEGRRIEPIEPSYAN
jgi:uncharacterized protein YndB with AHSA1/START domain